MRPKLILLKHNDFVRFNKSKGYYSPVLRVRVIASNQNTPRFGFIIPKKFLPKVTDRNKLKRRLKGILNANLNQIVPKDILLFPDRTTLKKKYSELEGEVVQVLKKANLWKSQAQLTKPSHYR